MSSPAPATAVAPAGSLPQGTPQTTRGAVKDLAKDLGDAGQQVDLGEPLEDALALLVLRLLA